jgi:hypothetical protein
VLIAYCTGLIIVCTALLVPATVFTIKSYWLLRQLSEGPPGRHEAGPAIPRAPVRSIEREYYDSGAVEAAESIALDDRDEVEWTGPVTSYTPSGR